MLQSTFYTYLVRYTILHTTISIVITFLNNLAEYIHKYIMYKSLMLLINFELIYLPF